MHYRVQKSYKISETSDSFYSGSLISLDIFLILIYKPFREAYTESTKQRTKEKMYLFQLCFKNVFLKVEGS